MSHWRQSRLTKCNDKGIITKVIGTKDRRYHLNNNSSVRLTHIDPYYLISEVYDGKFKYYRTPRIFAVEIRKYHHKNRLEKFYEIEQCKIAINNKLAILEQLLVNTGCLIFFRQTARITSKCIAKC